MADKKIIKQLKNKLNHTLEILDNEAENKQALGYEALKIIEDILTNDPLDIDTRILKIRLNADIFENSTAIIQEATYIIETKAFGEDRNIGYDWLYWVYNTVMAMPDKAKEILEEQLIEIQSLYKKHYEKDNVEGHLLNKLAQHNFDNDNKTEALKQWMKSFHKNPFITERNSFVGHLCLKNKDFKNAELFLLENWHLCIFDSLEFEQPKIAKLLEKLLTNNEINNNPNLIGLFYNYVRNQNENFGLTKVLDFHDRYLPALESWGNKYQNCSIIWAAIGNCYLLDSQNYEKAFLAYKTMLNGDNPYTYTGIERVVKASKKSGAKFLDLTLPVSGRSGDLYNILTELSTLADKSKKKKKKKKYIALAVEFGEKGYQQYKDYLIHNKGNVENNDPHKFAMLCNNYAIVLDNYADLFLEKEDLQKAYCLAGDIHIEGYKMSPFIENIENASSNYFKGKDYNLSIKYSLDTITDFKDVISATDKQFHYWQIVRSYVRLKDLKNADLYYQTAKTLFNKVGKGSKKSTSKFIFTAKIIYNYAVLKEKEFLKYIPEMEWYIDQEIALLEEPKEHGLVSYFLGLCYKEIGEKEKAISSFQLAVDYLHEADWEYYDTKCEQAEEELENLGVKAIKKKKKKQKSAFKRTMDALFFPFMLLSLIGGVLWAAATGGFNEKENKG